MAKAKGTAADPWVLKTPPGTSAFTVHRDTVDGTDMLVCTVGKTVLHYEYRRLKDLHDMLKAHGDWMELGSADEQKPAKPVRLRPGAARRRIRSAGGTGARRVCAAVSACTSRRSWRNSNWPRSSTTRAATGCAPAERGPRDLDVRPVPQRCR